MNNVYPMTTLYSPQCVCSHCVHTTGYNVPLFHPRRIVISSTAVCLDRSLLLSPSQREKFCFLTGLFYFLTSRNVYISSILSVHYSYLECCCSSFEYSLIALSHWSLNGKFCTQCSRKKKSHQLILQKSWDDVRVQRMWEYFKCLYTVTYALPLSTIMIYEPWFIAVRQQEAQVTVTI